MSRRQITAAPRLSRSLPHTTGPMAVLFAAFALIALAGCGDDGGGHETTATQDQDQYASTDEVPPDPARFVLPKHSISIPVPKGWLAIERERVAEATRNQVRPAEGLAVYLVRELDFPAGQLAPDRNFNASVNVTYKGRELAGIPVAQLTPELLTAVAESFDGMSVPGSGLRLTNTRVSESVAALAIHCDMTRPEGVVGQTTHLFINDSYFVLTCLTDDPETFRSLEGDFEQIVGGIRIEQ